MAAENSSLVVVSPAGYNQLFKMADRVFGGHRRKTLSGDEKGEVYQAACDSKDDGWVGGMLAILAFMMIYGLLNQTPELSGNNLQRDDAGGKSRDVQVSAKIEGVTEEKSLTITVEPRKYSRSEREALMRDVKAYIDACLQGDNSDLQHVNRPLFFPSDFPGENVTIEWQPEDYNLIRQDGSLGELSAYQLPIKTKVTAVIIYDQEKEFYSKEICLTAPEKSDEEVLDEQIREAVQAADQGSSEKLTLHLPDSVGGRVVEWKYQKQSQAGTILFIAFLFLAGCIWYQDNNLKKRLEERNEQLLYAYPGFVHRMILMLGSRHDGKEKLESVIG